MAQHTRQATRTYPLFSLLDEGRARRPSRPQVEIAPLLRTATHLQGRAIPAITPTSLLDGSVSGSPTIDDDGPRRCSSLTPEHGRNSFALRPPMLEAEPPHHTTAVALADSHLPGGSTRKRHHGFLLSKKAPWPGPRHDDRPWPRQFPRPRRSSSVLRATRNPKHRP